MREGREPGLMYVIAWGCNQYAPTPGNVPKHHTSLSSGSGLQQHHHPVDTPADPMKGKQISTWRTLHQVLLTLFVFAVLPLPMSQSDAPPRKMALQNFAPCGFVRHPVRSGKHESDDHGHPIPSPHQESAWRHQATAHTKHLLKVIFKTQNLRNFKLVGMGVIPLKCYTEVNN
jgi:hypothetical protein